MIQRPSDPAATERLRALCVALPEVVERLSHGEITWFIRGKTTFVQSWDHHHTPPGERGRNGFVCPAAPGVQAELVETEPDRFFRPPYVGVKGWIGVYLDVDDLDWDEVATIVRQAYRLVAPVKLAAGVAD